MNHWAITWSITLLGASVASRQPNAEPGTLSGWYCKWGEIRAPPRRPYLAVVLLLLVDCTRKRAGEGYDTQTPHPSCDPVFWMKSYFSHCHVFCVAVSACRFSPGANVSKRPGATWTEPGQANSALPQSCATTFPQGVHQVGVGVLKTPTALPTLPSSTLPMSALTQKWDSSTQMSPQCFLMMQTRKCFASQGGPESSVVLSCHPRLAWCVDKCNQDLKVKIWTPCGIILK